MKVEQGITIDIGIEEDNRKKIAEGLSPLWRIPIRFI